MCLGLEISEVEHQTFREEERQNRAPPLSAIRRAGAQDEEMAQSVPMNAKCGDNLSLEREGDFGCQLTWVESRLPSTYRSADAD